MEVYPKIPWLPMVFQLKPIERTNGLLGISIEFHTKTNGVLWFLIAIHHKTHVFPMVSGWNPSQNQWHTNGFLWLLLEIYQKNQSNPKTLNPKSHQKGKCLIFFLYKFFMKKLSNLRPEKLTQGVVQNHLLRTSPN